MIETMRADAGPLTADAVRSAEPATMITEPAFDQIYRKTARPLLRYLTRVGGDASLAEDILQKTYIRLLQATVPVMDEREMKNYLFRIASNLLSDHWRASGREKIFGFLPLRRARDEDDGNRDHDVRKMFEKLKPQERNLLWLAYVEGCTHEEIAQILRLEASSIRVLLFRAKSRLAATLRANGLVPEEVL
ncbi:MAG TPA: sigma-70 family RNA polymerase sigma factor [Thermoanaerobaculia bacterium]|nr:sigma-70 family RNA polymerase sigma factor [Thermoanaerobaculia bacterium]